MTADASEAFSSDINNMGLRKIISAEISIKNLNQI